MDEYMSDEYIGNSDLRDRARELADLSMEQEEAEALVTLEKLQALHAENPGETGVAIELARGARGMCGRKDVEAQKALGILEQLWAENGETEEILDELAKGLALLASGMDKMIAPVYDARLQGLTWGYPRLTKVVDEFMKSGQ